jgi:putative transposase
MNGKGRWIDRRMIERLCRSSKYECVYLYGDGWDRLVAGLI